MAKTALLTVLACAVLLPAASADAQVLLVPCEAPYECATNVRVANATVTWSTSFDRRHAGIYDIVHWQIAYTTGLKVEYLAQLMRPRERRMYYRFFVRERHSVWYTLGIHKHRVWREVRVSSVEQETMSGRLLVLLGHMFVLRNGGVDPLSLTF